MLSILMGDYITAQNGRISFPTMFFSACFEPGWCESTRLLVQLRVLIIAT
jgi:hypothetical protein